MVKYTKKYLKLKISNCRGLVDNATSIAQKNVYIGYLNHWIKAYKKLTKPKPKPKAKPKTKSVSK